jgi:hypothetical protein
LVFLVCFGRGEADRGAERDGNRPDSERVLVECCWNQIVDPELRWCDSVLEAAFVTATGSTNRRFRSSRSE